MDNSKKMTWYSLAFIAFSGVWGFGNVANGFMYFNGTQVIFSWVLMFAPVFCAVCIDGRRTWFCI